MSFLTSKDVSSIMITYEKIAQNLGTSRLVVSRVLKELEREGRLELYRGFIDLIL